MRNFLILLCFWSGCSSVFAAEQPGLGRLVSYETPGDMVVFSTLDESKVRELMTQLVQFQNVLETTISKRKMQVTGTPTCVFIVSGREWRDFLQPTEGTAGLFLRHRFANYLLVDGDANRSNALPVVFHEFTHYFLATESANTFPPWVNEGLAENLSMATFENGRVVYQVPMQRVLDARAGQWIPFDRMLAIDNQSPEYQEHRLARGFYGQAWLSVHYGMMVDKDFWSGLHAYLRDLNQLVPIDIAARRAFGGNLADIDNKLRAYSRQPTFKALTNPIGETPPVKLSAARALSEAEGLALVADVMFALSMPAERIKRLSDALTALEPHSSRSAVLRLKLLDRALEHVSFESEVNVLETNLAGDDWLSRREIAVLLLDRAMMNTAGRSRREDRKAEFERVLRLFEEALSRQPQDAQSLWGWGTAALQLHTNLALAEKRLKAAYVLMPYNPLIGVSLAEAYGTQGRPQEMIPVLQTVIRISNEAPVRRLATEMLNLAEDHVAEIERIQSERAKPRGR